MIIYAIRVKKNYFDDKHPSLGKIWDHETGPGNPVQVFALRKPNFDKSKLYFQNIFNIFICLL